MELSAKNKRLQRRHRPLRPVGARGAKSRARMLLPVLTGILACMVFALRYRQAAQANAALCAGSDLTSAPDAVFAQADVEASTDSERKRVCLTFDDGPSKNTAKVLNILAEQQVTATFFVIAAENNQDYLPLVQQEVEQGNQVALHSCTHEYSAIYNSPEAYWKDIDQLKQQLSAYIDVSGINCLRFPGGSTNTVSHKYGGGSIMKTLKAQAEEKGYHWVDWNVCADDAVGGHPSAAKIYKNVIGDVGDKKTCVVLMHDTAATSTTVEALPDIIEWFRQNGYVFCTISELYPD